MKISHFLSSLAIIASFSTAAPADDTTVLPVRYHTCDCHLHFVDFLQHTDGMPALLAAMDKSGVDQSMISGMPLVKEWSAEEHQQPAYYLDDDARCYWYSATDVLVARGNVASMQARYQDADRLYQEALQLYRQIPDRLGEANVLRARGEVASMQGRYEDAERLFEQAAHDRSKAYELKRELDRLNQFASYEDRFLDLFLKRD